MEVSEQYMGMGTAYCSCVFLLYNKVTEDNTDVAKYSNKE